MVALAAWTLEKFRPWTDHDGNLPDIIGVDPLLDNLTVHWLSSGSDHRCAGYPATYASVAATVLLVTAGFVVWERQREPGVRTEGRRPLDKLTG